MLRPINQNLFCLILFSTSVNAVYQLQPISTIYIPTSYDSTDSPKYAVDGGAVEQSAYDKNEYFVYGAGSSYLHVVDFSAVSNPVILKKMPISGVANDIELCGNYVAITVSSKDPYQNGTVCVYGLYNRKNGNFPMVQTITVGSEPDMLKFTKDCRTILVANEGEAFTSDDEEDIVNPEGSVSIIRFTSDDLSTTPTISTADFVHFNSRSDEYEMKHIRYPYKGYISKTRDTFSQNLEPEYIALNSNESKAYIALQENNAIAIVDMVTSSIDEIIGMGVKSWGNLKFDASDKDSGINLQSWPVYSFYQPDSMIHYEIDGVEYLATSNEGDSFEYETKNDKWEEEKRGEKLVQDSLISESIPEYMTKYLEERDELGRLQFSTVDGLDKNGKIETLYHYGGRSWSIFRIDGDNLTMIYDSGDDVERMMALYYPEVFNGNTKPDEANEEKPEDLFDTRSDNKGPECESLAYGEVDGDKLIFMGSDRSSSIMIYKLHVQNPPIFQSIYRAGGTDETYEALLNKRNLGDLDPEDLRFIPGNESPTGTPSLLVTSSVSGTVSLYEIADLPAPPTANASQDPPSSASRVASLNLVFLFLLAAVSKCL